MDINRLFAMLKRVHRMATRMIHDTRDPVSFRGYTVAKVSKSSTRAARWKECIETLRLAPGGYIPRGFSPRNNELSTSSNRQHVEPAEKSTRCEQLWPRRLDEERKYGSSPAGCGLANKSVWREEGVRGVVAKRGNSLTYNDK